MAAAAAPPSNPADPPAFVAFDFEFFVGAAFFGVRTPFDPRNEAGGCWGAGRTWAVGATALKVFI